MWRLDGDWQARWRRLGHWGAVAIDVIKEADAKDSGG